MGPMANALTVVEGRDPLAGPIGDLNLALDLARHRLHAHLTLCPKCDPATWWPNCNTGRALTDNVIHLEEELNAVRRALGYEE